MAKPFGNVAPDSNYASVPALSHRNSNTFRETHNFGSNGKGNVPRTRINDNFRENISFDLKDAPVSKRGHSQYDEFNTQLQQPFGGEGYKKGYDAL